MIARARAPLRLGLAGGGTDVSPYCDLHGGAVLNATIDRYAYATVEDATGQEVLLEALDRGVAWSGTNLTTVPPELRLLAGTYRRICDQFLDGERPPLRLRTFSDAPPGSGLGSSSTMVVAVVAALSEYFQIPLGEYDLARIAYVIERGDLALAGGKQDQYAAAFGGVNFMEFSADDHVIVNPLRIKQSIQAELEASIVLYFTGISRESANIIQEQRRNARDNVGDAVQAMHELKQEAVAMKESLLKADFAAMAATFQRGWESKKRMTRSISNPLIDATEAVARRNGALATKISGAGGGGFMMFMCDPVDRLRLSAALVGEGGHMMDVHFTRHGAFSWRTTR